MHWFRWYHGTANDSKLRRIATHADTSVANVVAVWAMLLESASENSERGMIGSWDADDVAFTLGISVDIIVCITAAMDGKLLSGQRVMNWSKRQPKREKPDGSTTDESAHIGTHGHISGRMGPRGEERRGDKRTTKTKDSSPPAAPKPRKSKPDPKYPHYPTDVCSSLYDTYRRTRGPVDFATFRRETAPLFPTHYTTEQIHHALECWGQWVETLTPDKAKFERATTFTQNAARWVELGAMPLVDQWGVVTERGRVVSGVGA